MSDTPAPQKPANELVGAEADAEAHLVESAEKVAKSAEKVVESAEKVAEKAGKVAESAEKVAETARTPKEPRKGVYTLEEGDTPALVSIKFYGRSHKAVSLARANMDCDWQTGSVVTLI